jgi:hypothetical protein
MQIEVQRKDSSAASGDAVVIPLTKADAPPRALRALDDAIGGLLARVWDAGDCPKSGEVLSPRRGITAKRRADRPRRREERDGRVAARGRRPAPGARAREGKRANIAVTALRRVKPEAAQALCRRRQRLR